MEHTLLQLPQQGGIFRQEDSIVKEDSIKEPVHVIQNICPVSGSNVRAIMTERKISIDPEIVDHVKDCAECQQKAENSA